MKYKVKLIYTYSEEVIVEADSKDEAENIATHSDDTTRIIDDSLYDTEVTEVKG